MRKVESTIYLAQIDKVKHFVNLANKYESDISVATDRHIVDGKSILGILSLKLDRQVTVIAEGNDAEEFLNQLKTLD